MTAARGRIRESIWNRKRQTAARLCLSASIFALTLGTSGNFSRQGISLHMPMAYASYRGEDIFEDMEPLKAEALEAQRGGFRVAGLDINVGVSVASSIGGFVQVTSSFSMSDAGKIINLGTQVTTHPNIQMPDTSAIVDQQIAAAKAAIKPVANTHEIVSNAQKQASDAVDTALNAFSQPEVFENAEITEAKVETKPASGPVSNTATNVPLPATTPPSTAADISNTINETVKTVTAALPSTPDVPPTKATENRQVSQPGSTKLTAADAIPSGQAASPSTSPQAAQAVVSTVTEPDTVKTTVTVPAQTATANNTKGTQTQVTQKTPVAAATDTKIANSNTAETGAQQKAVPASVVPTVDTARITHTTDNGHLSVIENTLNGVSIRQMVSMNLTIENFKAVQHTSELRRTISTIARQISIQSLRR